MPEIPARKAKQITRLQARVAQHRATEAGVLRTAFDTLTNAIDTLHSGEVVVDSGFQMEIKAFAENVRRFRRQMKLRAAQNNTALTQVDHQLQEVEALLRKAQGSGYGVQHLTQVAERDLHGLKRVHASVKHRSREAAFVLAELEQAVDPLPGLKIASAAQRKRNDKIRKSQAPSEGSLTTEPLTGAEPHGK